jgi:hypothetical protein
MDALQHYGGQCACCGETEPAFLAIDHVNGGGNAHRREVGYPKGGGAFFYWLRKHGYPDGYQVLCHNCNMAKTYLGVCPHQLR